MNPLRQLINSLLPKSKAYRNSGIESLDKATAQAVVSILHSLESDTLQLLSEHWISNQSRIISPHNSDIKFFHLSYERPSGFNAVFSAHLRLTLICKKDGVVDDALHSWIKKFFSVQQNLSNPAYLQELKLSSDRLIGVFPESRQVDTLTVHSDLEGHLVTRPTGIVTWSLLCDLVKTHR